MIVTFVADDEILYRRIPHGKNLYVVQSDGTVKFSSQAFADRSFRPSVDRAELRHYDPHLTQKDPSDGVASVITKDVRSIDTVVQNDEKGNPIRIFCADVEHVPIMNHPDLPDNLAHAEIYLIPECSNKTVFRKFCERLALLAGERPWEIEPQSQDEA